MNIEVSNLCLKLVLLIFIVCSNSTYGNNNSIRVLGKSNLSPKSISYQTFVDIEKKEVFIKNLIHGSSSKFFTLTDTFTGLLANLQLLPILDRDSMLLNREFVTYLSAEHEKFFRFSNNFKHIQDNYIFSKDKNTQKAWVEFKKLSDEVVSSCEKLKVKITGLLKEQKNITNNLKIRKTLELVLKGNATLSKQFSMTIKCVEKSDSLVNVLIVKDLIDAVLKNFEIFNVNPDLFIEVDSAIVSLKDSILGNQILLINVLENFFNNAMQHKKEKINMNFFLDSSANEVVFQFNNDADPIEDYALEKINNRERIFYLNYSTKGMGLGTTLSWYVAKMFGHSVKVYNTDKGVSFEYRVPVLRREDKESSLYWGGVNATIIKYQRYLKEVANSVLRGPFKKAA